MGMWEERQRQLEAEVEAYNRIQSPKEYRLSGQMHKDRASGKLSDDALQAVVDAEASQDK